jgi:hypothetical protein
VIHIAACLAALLPAPAVLFCFAPDADTAASVWKQLEGLGLTLSAFVKGDQSTQPAEQGQGTLPASSTPAAAAAAAASSSQHPQPAVLFVADGPSQPLSGRRRGRPRRQEAIAAASAADSQQLLQQEAHMLQPAGSLASFGTWGPAYLTSTLHSGVPAPWHHVSVPEGLRFGVELETVVKQELRLGRASAARRRGSYMQSMEGRLVAVGAKGWRWVGPWHPALEHSCWWASPASVAVHWGH